MADQGIAPEDSSFFEQIKMSPIATPPVTRTSTCLCKSISIEVTGQDKGTVLCHCNNCKQASGSAFMHNHRFVESSLKVTRGEELVREYADTSTVSGNTIFRHFCSKCGSPLWLSSSAIANFVGLNAGNLEGERRQPTGELFEYEKYCWIGNVIDTAS